MIDTRCPHTVGVYAMPITSGCKVVLYLISSACIATWAAMIVPLTIFTVRDKAGVRIDRSRHYLVDELDRLYGARAHTLPSWSTWVAAIERFAPLAQDAFDGRVDLHQQSRVIDELASTYERLQKEAHAAGLRYAGR